MSRQTIIAQTTGFSLGSLPFTYLGFHIHFSTVPLSDYQPLIMKIQKKVASWKSNFLSAGGKLILIKHVLSLIPMHLLQYLHPPKYIIENIHKIFANFFWGTYEQSQKHHWIKWVNFCKPVLEGGLGVRCLYDSINCFHAKLAWRLLTNDSMLCCFMYQKYVLRMSNLVEPLVKKKFCSLETYFPLLT